jgi:hypothetical protein
MDINAARGTQPIDLAVLTIGSRDALGYVLRHAFAAGTASTLKKAMRARRIQNGERPQRLIRPRKYIGRSLYELHPTKGWRLA